MQWQAKTPPGKGKNALSLSHAQSQIALYIIPTDEELMIARHARSLLAA
jgi:acetate kinase